MNDTTIRAIQTRYAGCHFRSRLEARWAVFFDALGIRWDYEPEGFELPSGRYLPDFWLPGLDAFYEVKGEEPTERESNLAEELSRGTGKEVFIAWGDIPRSPDHTGHDRRSRRDHRDIWTTCDYDYAWCVCPWCGKVGLEFDGRGARVCPPHPGEPVEPFTNPHPDKLYTADHPKLLLAYTAARSARFEFGETPR